MLWPLRKRVRVDGIAQYHQGDVFLPGAQSVVYESDFVPEPPQGLIGVGRVPTLSFSPVQPPPTFIPNYAGIVVGPRRTLGGLSFNPPIREE